MRWSTITATLFVLVLIQCTFVSSFWFKPNPPKVCHTYPRAKYARDVEYFIGFTNLFEKPLDRRRSLNWKVFPWIPKHSLLMFRGQIFEWLSSSQTKTDRKPYDCRITWTMNGQPRGTSRCLLTDAQKFASNYRKECGVYNLFVNNCHYFVNRLAAHLDTNCGR